MPTSLANSDRFSRSGPDVRIFEGDEAMRFGKPFEQQSGLPGLSWSGDEDSREGQHGLLDGDL